VRPQSGAPSFQQRTPEQQQAPSQQPQEQMDPILRAKEILPHLKEALVVSDEWDGCGILCILAAQC